MELVTSMPSAEILVSPEPFPNSVAACTAPVTARSPEDETEPTALIVDAPETAPSKFAGPSCILYAMG